MTTPTKTAALEALLNDALSLLRIADEARNYLRENSKFTDAEAEQIFERDIAQFESKHTALWDRCEAVAKEHKPANIKVVA